MSPAARYRLAGLGVLAVAAVVVAAIFGAIDLEEQSMLDALDPPVYAVEVPVAAGVEVEPTVPPTVSPATSVVQRSVVVPSAPAARLDNAMQVTPTDPPPPSTVPLWAGPIPVYGNRGGCTIENATIITARFAARGASLATQEWALRMVSRETGCDTSRRNLNSRTRDDSYGICQLNARSGHFGPNGILNGWDRDRLLVDLVYAADACAHMWTVCGRGPWTPPYSCTTPAELR